MSLRGRTGSSSEAISLRCKNCFAAKPRARLATTSTFYKGGELAVKVRNINEFTAKRSSNTKDTKYTRENLFFAFLLPLCPFVNFVVNILKCDIVEVVTR